VKDDFEKSLGEIFFFVIGVISRYLPVRISDFREDP
jgi:hypothetical protein